MNKSVDATHEHFNGVRTGRASAALLDRIQIDYYGTPSPLKNIATITVPEARLLTIQPFDPSSIKQIERAIQESDLGLTPVERRQADPAADPAAHGGAPQGVRQAGSCHGRGGAGRRSATSAAT